MTNSKQLGIAETKMKETPPLGHLIEKLTHHIEEYERKIIEKSDLSTLSPRQLYCLDEIFHLDQPGITELAEKIDVSKPSATALVNKLEKNGYIQKVQSEEDKRFFHIILTKKGQKLAALHDTIHYKFAEIMTGNLSEAEINQLTVLLGKIIENID
ncbi:MAG: MarR family transcriptional regulator [Spirochaetales bacterium]|nr:MarR family transcriptional regulator [Spirochaetales bacterium]